MMSNQNLNKRINSEDVSGINEDVAVPPSYSSEEDRKRVCRIKTEPYDYPKF
jgi:hypothetical protein